MPRTVLVVDDGDATPTTFWPVLCERGFQPIQVYTGAEALDAVAKHQPDLIDPPRSLLEDTSGFELCDRLKQLPRTSLIQL